MIDPWRLKKLSNSSNTFRSPFKRNSIDAYVTTMSIWFSHRDVMNIGPAIICTRSCVVSWNRRSGSPVITEHIFGKTFTIVSDRHFVRELLLSVHACVRALTNDFGDAKYYIISLTLLEVLFPWYLIASLKLCVLSAEITSSTM